MSKQTPAASLTIASAAELMFRQRVGPAITAYSLGRLVFEMFRAGNINGHPLRVSARMARRSDYYTIRKVLADRGLVQEDRSLPNTVLLVTRQDSPDPAAVMCEADPFGFISHLTSMAYHGLSNRIPRVLFFTTLPPRLWSVAAAERMRKDLGEYYDAYLESGLPTLRRPRIQRFQGNTIDYVHTREVAGAFRVASETGVRVSTIGRTFLDMLQRPELCGGMAHVIEVFEAHGRPHLPLIINELNSHGTKIDRVRAGYILEEHCEIQDPRVEAWIKDVQRGGSRKLDPAGEYASTFSDRWMLSINV